MSLVRGKQEKAWTRGTINGLLCKDTLQAATVGKEGEGKFSSWKCGPDQDDSRDGCHLYIAPLKGPADNHDLILFGLAASWLHTITSMDAFYAKFIHIHGATLHPTKARFELSTTRVYPLAYASYAAGLQYRRGGP